MNIWLIQANEPMPNIDQNQRLFRTGMLAKELNKKGHNVTWFATTFDHYTKRQRFEKNVDIDINEYYRLKMIWAPSYKKNISLKRIINHKYMAVNFRKVIATMENPDIIYCSFPTIELAEQAIAYGRKNNIKVILDIRDLWPDIFSQNLSFPLNYLVRPYQKIMDIKTKKIFKQAFCLHGVSRLALQWGLDKIERSANTYDYSYYIGYDEQEAKVTQELKSEIQYITFIGTIGNQIQYSLICKIAKELQIENLPVKIIVGGDGPQMNSFKDMAKNISNIEFLGWIDSKKIDEILKKTFMGLVPYNNTFDFQVGVGNKFGECMAYALPTIVTCNGTMEELLMEYDCGIASTNVIEIVNYIKNLFFDKEQYTLKKKNAKQLFDEKLCANKIYEKLVQYLEDIPGGTKK